MNSSWLVEFLMIFKSDIDKLKACPIAPKMELKELKGIYYKIR